MTAADPAGQDLVTGKPLTAGVAENAQVAERWTAAVRVAVPPGAGRPSGVAWKLATAGPGAATVTVAVFAWVPPDPLAVSSKVYDLTAAPVLDGSFTVLEAFPDEQEMVTGSPLTVLLAENVHVLAPEAAALRVTLPPAAGRVAGVTANDLIAGLAAWWTVVPAGAGAAVITSRAAAQAGTVARRPRSQGFVMRSRSIPVPGHGKPHALG